RMPTSRTRCRRFPTVSTYRRRCACRCPRSCRCSTAPSKRLPPITSSRRSVNGRSPLADQKRAGQEFWDANPCGGRWKSYRDYLDWVPLTEPYVYEVLGNHQWTGKRVLEVGCGQGAVLNHLAGAGARTVGIDMSSS